MSIISSDSDHQSMAFPGHRAMWPVNKRKLNLRRPMSTDVVHNWLVGIQDHNQIYVDIYIYIYNYIIIYMYNIYIYIYLITIIYIYIYIWGKPMKGDLLTRVINVTNHLLLPG